MRSYCIVSFVLAAVGLVGCSSAAPSDVTASGSEASRAGAKKPARWAALGDASPSQIAGGPWTLAQSGASSASPSAGYCVGGIEQTNPGTMVMQPYYQPYIVGVGALLQGYFDWRPKDDDEAIVAASSTDYGATWTFQQKVLELTTECPASDATTIGNDDGLGHPAVLSVGGTSYLYALDRTTGNVDSAGLAVYALDPTEDAPLAPTPAAFTVPQRTTGLLSPDGIFGVVPGQPTTTIIYLQKELRADKSFPAAQQCAGAKPNHDVTRLRIATTDDGVHFTDQGALAGLNDPTDVSPTGTRYIGPRGTLLALSGGRFGMFFSGGNCLDADSDALHYVGYAESTDLVTWHVVNGIDAPILSIAPVATTVNGQPVTIPATAPIVDSQDWFAGRVYGPSVTRVDARTVSIVFSGYHTKKPAADMGGYRTVGQVFLASSVDVRGGSEDE